ncbi:MAG TPA: hypothetical protein VFT39_04130 [Vicinamibacterales bacterium]|nr:hypothetical protein [Vicinamibacterales bacterium]
MRFSVLALSMMLLPGAAAANDWKVSDPEKDPNATGARMTLRVGKSGISLIPANDSPVAREIAPKDVLAIWYDDRVVRSYSREWWRKIDEVCSNWCRGEDITIPLTLLATGGAGYLATLPFEDHRHFVNIHYRAPDGAQVLTLRTNWFDHFWLMTDLSRAVGRKWLNMPQQRTKLFWSWTDRPRSFDPGAHAGSNQLDRGEYHVLLWDDGKGRGLVMFFSGTRDDSTLAAAEPVTVEKSTAGGPDPEYCNGRDRVKHVLRLQFKNKRATFPAAVRSCGEAGQRGGAT